jgi:hypothetical protein
MTDFSPLRRPSYFAGQLLTAEDLSLEQDYIREKQKRHNRTLHGFGIVSGLRVSIAAGSVVIEPGLALDCEGNELVVTAEQPKLPLNATGIQAYVNLRYAEISESEVPADGATSVIFESVKIDLSATNCNRCHRHLRGRWLACGLAHDVTIAKLRRDKGGWRVERRYRAAVVK